MSKEEPKSKPKTNKFSKTAFIEAAENTTERLLLQALLDEEKVYTKDEVAKVVNKWKNTKVKKEAK